ncbi:MAG: glutamate synthase central domain-containing protein, partial [Ancalomicrobiaceae bacterium]|nr:glutamate synthase central domain-containing protein [Ancalomicrobiaceae bacterium]
MAEIESEGALGLGGTVVTATTTKATAFAADRSTAKLLTGPDGLPQEQGLFDPALNRDACGVGFVVDIKGRKSHGIVKDALHVLENLEHRGAVGADPLMGDGAGILVQIPHQFFAQECATLGFSLPPAGTYGVGQFFLPRDAAERERALAIVERAVTSEGLQVLGWRDVPVDNSKLSDGVRATEPLHRQIFVAPKDAIDGEALERRLYIARKSLSGDVYEADWNGATKRNQDWFYTVSFSARTIVYKGMFLSYQVASYYPDLSDERFVSALAMVHQRFSTNTFPSWKLAHPYRMVAHNGEINTLRGNVNWMYARQATTTSTAFGDDIGKIWPISYEGQSDTACFDNALEFLLRGGYSLAHAVMTLIPEAWTGNDLMDPERRAFYEYHAALMEPWDGPAAVCFTDGLQIGATLDRNGLRPARYVITDDDRVILASEAGTLPIPEDKIVAKWRLQPGKMLLIDLEAGRIIADDEIKRTISTAQPYAEWIDDTQMVLEDLPEVSPRAPKTLESLLDLQQSFGYTQEDLKLLMPPMAVTGQEAVGSMGTDTPISALSSKSKLLYTYFKQNFAQVTNPPIDPIREELVMSLVSFIGPRPNLFDQEGSKAQKRLEVRQPILTNEDLEKIRTIENLEGSGFKTITIDVTYPAANGPAGMRPALDAMCVQAEAAVRTSSSGQIYNIIVLSDRMVGREGIAVPALLATAAVHHHLIRKGLRTRAGLVVESGEPREIHHFALLAGYGAEAINPYLAFDTLLAMQDKFPKVVDAHEIVYRYIKSIGKGLLKVMSKMGISTYQSYCGAQIFDAIGLQSEFIKEFFFGTATKIEGIGLDEIAKETVERHTRAFGTDPVLAYALDVGGEYAQRMRGEAHVWTSDVVAGLQHSVRTNSFDKFQKDYSSVINAQSEQLTTIRGLFRIKTADELGRAPVALDDVEPAVAIVKRFATGAMSFGSISREAHTTLAIAMNRIGGRSNTGEGGEEADRFKPLANGDSMRSAIKQVASGRFGVTTEYLVNSDQMQIKMAQGAKPGEGGQLPGHKVDAVIGRVRHAMP